MTKTHSREVAVMWSNLEKLTSKIKARYYRWSQTCRTKWFLVCCAKGARIEARSGTQWNLNWQSLNKFWIHTSENLIVWQTFFLCRNLHKTFSTQFSIDFLNAFDWIEITANTVKFSIAPNTDPEIVRCLN